MPAQEKKVRRIAFVVDAASNTWSSHGGDMFTFPANQHGNYAQREFGHVKAWTSLRVDIPTKQRLDDLRSQLHTLLNDVQDDGGQAHPEYLRELSMVRLLEVLSTAVIRVLEPASGKAIAATLRAAGESDATIAAARAAGEVHAVRRSRRKSA